MPINEKTLEINICTEIFYYHWRRYHQRILFFGPSLRQEAKRGYDIKAYSRGIRPFYIQFKSGKYKSNLNQAIYKINSDSKNRQHHLLTALARTSIVHYGLPLLFSMTDIEQNKWQLLKLTEWLSVKTMQPLPPPPFVEHEIHMNIGTRRYTIHSQERRRPSESISWLKAYNSIEQSEIMDPGLVLKENDIAIREVLDSEDIPDEMAFGLVFGAMPG